MTKMTYYTKRLKHSLSKYIFILYIGKSGNYIIHVIYIRINR